MLSVPVVFAVKVLYPTAVLSSPALLEASKEAVPIAVFREAVVTYSKAF